MVVGVTLIFDGTPQIIVQRCQIATSRWPNDISSAPDNAIFKNRAQNIECNFGCVARSAVLLKPNVASLQFLWTKIRSIWPNYACGPKSEPNSDSFWVRRLCNVCMQVFSAPNAQFCLFTYMPRLKWASFLNMIFFVRIGIFCKSIAGPLPSAVQACTQPQFCLFTYLPRSKWASSEKKFFFCQNRHLL